MRISDWSSDVCSSDLLGDPAPHHLARTAAPAGVLSPVCTQTWPLLSPSSRPSEQQRARAGIQGQALEHSPWTLGSSPRVPTRVSGGRSEEHTSELQSLMRLSYAVYCLQKKKQST